LDELIKALKVLMADVVTFYFQAQGYHWNVEGQDFSQYHNLFGDIYEDVQDSIDPIAENIRKLQDYSPFTLQKFIDERTFEVSGVAPTPRDMANALQESNEAVLRTLNATFKAADTADKQGIADFISGRIDMHEKWAWMLRASTK
jgi:starvation-inducible DNA-binding protein